MNFPFSAPGSPSVAVTGFGIVVGAVPNAPYIPEPPPPAPGLIAALQARMLATEEFVEALPGGIFFGPADEEADENPPYATWVMVTETSFHDTRGMVGKVATFRMKLVGPDEEELRRIHENIWEENFHPNMEPFAIRDRRFEGLYDGPAHIDVGVAASPLGDNMIQRWWDFQVFTSVNRVTP